MVVTFPQEHMAVRNYVKHLIITSAGNVTSSNKQQQAAALAVLPQANVRVGISLNFNKLCGDYCSKSDYQTVDKAGIKQLFDAVDFVGE